MRFLSVLFVVFATSASQASTHMHTTVAAAHVRTFQRHHPNIFYHAQPASTEAPSMEGPASTPPESSLSTFILKTFLGLTHPAR